MATAYIKDAALDQINARIAALPGLNQIFLADFISVGEGPHIAQPELSKILTGYRVCSPSRAKQIETALNELEWAYNWYSPWQPPLTEARRLRNFIVAAREFKEITRVQLRALWELAA
jgi:hypothetical protein